jgi:hypothetical protein
VCQNPEEKEGKRTGGERKNKSKKGNVMGHIRKMKKEDEM